MSTAHIAAVVLMAVIGFMVLGAYLWHKVVGTPSDRELALEAQLDAMKRASYLSAEFFQAQAELREEIAEAARQSATHRTRRARPRSAATSNPTDIGSSWRA